MPTSTGTDAERSAASRAALAIWQREGKWADVALRGVSMDPIIRDGAILRVRFGPMTGQTASTAVTAKGAAGSGGSARDLRVGDVVLFSGSSGLIAHRVIRVGRRGRRAGWVRVKGDPLTSRKASWIRLEEILGRVVSVTQPDGSRLYLNTPAGRLLSRTAAWVSMTLGAVDARLGRSPGRPPAGALTGRVLRGLLRAHQAAQELLETPGGRMLSPEERLLIAACRPRLGAQDVDRIVREAGEVVDWDLAGEHAVSLGLAPLLSRNLSDPRLAGVCPEAFVARLSRASHLSAYLALHRRQELVRVLDRLAELGIEPVLLKGAALAAVVYDDPLMRTMNDLDLLLREPEIPRAIAALESLSYQPLFRPRHADAGQRAVFYGRHHHATPLVAPKGRAVVELHRHIVTMAEARHYDIETIRARARRATFEGRAVLVPSPADLVLHTCLHLSYADRFVGKLRDLLDLHETVSLHGDAIDWGAMLAEVPSDSAARCLYSCLDLARRLYGTPVPADFLHEIRRASRLGLLGAGLLRALACSMLFEAKASGQGVLTTASARWCCDTLLRRSGWTARLKALAALLAQA